MDSMQDSSTSGQGQKNDKKRKAEEPGYRTFADLVPTMFSKKINETNAGTPTAQREAMEMAAASYRASQQRFPGSVTDMAQATPNEKVKQTNADTSAPAAAVQGGPVSDYSLSFHCAFLAYERTGNKVAGAYLMACNDCSSSISTVRIASGGASWALAHQEYDRFAASLVDRMGIKEDTIVGWAHNNARAALQLLVPTQPDMMRHAMVQLKRYAPVSMES
ncbi:hypothetical protein LTR27_011968 [Elasticomyces elasticus]|nr:hypothetical protein LTR27_011968 [Elasticomyces elasticus]